MDPSPLSGQVAIVTGGASGIGEATVKLLAGEGASVVALDRDSEGLSRVVREVEEAGAVARAQILDLSNTALIAAAVAEVIETEGRIDILVNCAGIFGEQGTILDLSEKTWDLVAKVYDLIADNVFLPDGTPVNLVVPPEIVYGARTGALAQAHYTKQGVGANIFVSRSWAGWPCWS